MDKHRANSLDDLFREQFHDHEIAPEEDYWPYLEKSLNRLSFFRFGWKHINIYNVSIGLLAIAIPVLYFLWPQEETILPEEPRKPEEKETIFGVDSFQTKKKSISIEEAAAAKKEFPKNTKKEFKEKTIDKGERQKDSIPVAPPVLEEKITPVQPEPVKIVEEEKPKKKKIIYVVQQDTIVEKDTVKVRRKRKN